MFNHHLYIIENHTNMHVGSGDANFDLVDKQIQRDVITNYPTIHSSSLKGALKEYCRYRHSQEHASSFLGHIFGDEEQSGKVRFIDAHLLGVPMRSNQEPYYVCTSPKIIAHFIETAKLFDIKIDDLDALEDFANYTGENAAIPQGNATIETIEAYGNNTLDFSKLEKYVGSPVAMVPNKKFDKLLKDLPVIARNQLNNGESKNLWYEEVLPRKSRLYTVISDPNYIHRDDERLKKHFERFQNYLTDETTIQIGANASVGYGVCCFEEAGDEE